MRKRIVDVRCERVTRILIYTCIGLIYKEKRTLSAFYVRSSCVCVRVTLICIMWHDGACGRIGHQFGASARRVLTEVSTLSDIDVRDRRQLRQAPQDSFPLLKAPTC